MDRQALVAAGANYPYLQGLWALPMGLILPVVGLSNLERGPSGGWLLGIAAGALVLCGVGSLLIARHYRQHYGEVTPTTGRRVRHGVAVVAWALVLFVGANRYLLWSADSPVCVYASAFALATLAYYAILVGLRAHHVAIWGTVLVAGLLPVWGGLGADRDAIAMIPLGLALAVSGLLDQRLLARDFASFGQPLEGSNAGR